MAAERFASVLALLHGDPSVPGEDAKAHGLPERWPSGHMLLVVDCLSATTEV